MSTIINCFDADCEWELQDWKQYNNNEFYIIWHRVLVLKNDLGVMKRGILIDRKINDNTFNIRIHYKFNYILDYLTEDLLMSDAETLKQHIDNLLIRYENLKSFR